MKNVLLLLAVFVYCGVFAQTNYEDVVYLKNGSVIHGVIIEQVPNTSIKIKTTGGDVILFKIEEVSKFTKEEVKTTEQTKRAALPDSVYHLKTMATLEVTGLAGLSADVFVPNYRLATTTNTSVGYSHYKTSPVSAGQLSMTIDREVKKRVYIGGGLGIAFAAGSLVPATNVVSYSVLVPGYLDVRYLILKGKYTPYIAGQAGAAMYAMRGTIGGGGLLGLQFGGRFAVSRGAALSVFAGYRMQHITTTQDIQYTDEMGNNTIMVHSHTHSVLHFLSIGAGISF